MTLSKQQLHDLARHGARQRLAEIGAEIAAIQKAFGGSAAKGRRRGKKRGRKPQGRKRSKLSAAGRAAISRAQKKRWAAIKATKAGAKK